MKAIRTSGALSGKARSLAKGIRAFTPVFAGYAVNALMACGEKEIAVRADTCVANVRVTTLPCKR